MDSLNIAEGKARFSALIGRAEAGETVQITRRGKPVARIVPIEPAAEPIDWEAIDRLRESLPKNTMTIVEMRRLDVL